MEQERTAAPVVRQLPRDDRGRVRVWDRHAKAYVWLQPIDARTMIEAGDALPRDPDEKPTPEKDGGPRAALAEGEDVARLTAALEKAIAEIQRLAGELDTRNTELDAAKSELAVLKAQPTG